MQQEERCRRRCEPKGQCYACKTILCAHKVIEHLEKGHIIYPLPYHVKFNPTFEQEEKVLECNECILKEVWRMTTERMIQLQALEEEVDDSVYMTEESFTINQVREKLGVIEPVSELLFKLNNQIEELTVRFLDPMVVSASEDQTIRVWKLGQSKVLEGHTAPVKSVALCQSKQLLVSASEDRTIRVWSLATGQTIKLLEGHTQEVWSVAVSSECVVSASQDKTVRVWSLDTGEPILILKGHRSTVASVAISRNETLIVSASHDLTLRVWSLNNGELIRVLKGHSDWVKSVAISESELYTVSGSYDFTVRVWSLVSGDQISILKHSGYIYSVAISSDECVVSAGEEGIKIWSLSSKEVIRVLKGHSGSVLSVNLSTDEEYLVSGGNFADPSIRVWDLSTGEQTQLLTGHTDDVTSVILV